MTAYCFECKKMMGFSVIEKTEEDSINGVCFSMRQKYAFCDHCHSEVLPEEIVEENTRIAHDAYREALGIITVAEMQQILNMYSIGARPLSLLLDMGENTIERQMKHTIPEKEKSDRLKKLLNPLNMIKLLIQHSERISKVAFTKSLGAALLCLGKMISAEETQNAETVNFGPKEKQYISANPVSFGKISESVENRPSLITFSSQPVVSKSNPFDCPDAA